MRHYFFPAIVLFFSLTVSSCAPSRQEADKKLATACQSAIKALSEPSDEIEIKKSSFKSAKGHENATLRVVTLEAQFIHDHGESMEKIYTCSYAEQWSMFGYLPEFYNLEKDGQQYGNYDGHGMGELNDLLKITDATEKALR